MTFPESTTPRTGTEPAPQSCGDDPFGLVNIPAFLRRTAGDTKLASLARFASSHGFRVEPMDGGIVVYIPWTHRDGSTGETGHEVSTMAALRDVLGESRDH